MSDKLPAAALMLQALNEIASYRYVVVYTNQLEKYYSVSFDTSGEAKKFADSVNGVVLFGEVIHYGKKKE